LIVTGDNILGQNRPG